MGRALTLSVVGLLAVGTVVAFVSAQETSSRRRSRYSVADAASPEPANLPSTAAPGSLSERLRAAGEQMSQESRSPATDTAPADDTPAGLAPAEVEAAEVPSDFDPAARSVLKRPQPSLVDEAAPPRLSPTPSAPRAAMGASSRRVIPGGGAAAAGNGSARGLTLSSRSPALRVDVAGPPSLAVGKPADYLVTVSNDSDTAASEVQVRLSIPGWVSVTGSAAGSGEAALHADTTGAPQLIWVLPALAANSREQLRLQLATSEGDAFELAVDCTCRPVAASASITVKRPQIEVSLAGPGEMIYGETKSFTLTVSNPGTGDAEQVVVNLSTGDGRNQPIEIGTIPAGHKKDVPLEVAANQAGQMSLQVTATGEGGLTADTAANVLVRKAELSLAMDGPPLKYAGAEAVYLVTVANTGNSPADQVQVGLTLPPGAKYLGGLEGATAAAGNLKWKVSSLPAGAERQYEVRVQLQSPGVNRLVLQASAAAAGTASSQAETEVEAVSDLKLVVNDPSGPLPTDDDAVYEVQVTNRGSQAAEQVKVVVQFSEGIEPQAFEGCQAKIVPGQVLCQPLPSLGAGEQVTLRIKAKATAAGTHQFRVEVTAADDGTRLVSEGTTRFFSETGRASAAVRTAERPLQPTPATLPR